MCVAMLCGALLVGCSSSNNEPTTPNTPAVSGSTTTPLRTPAGSASTTTTSASTKTEAHRQAESCLDDASATALVQTEGQPRLPKTVIIEEVRCEGAWATGTMVDGSDGVGVAVMHRTDRWHWLAGGGSFLVVCQTSRKSGAPAWVLEGCADLSVPSTPTSPHPIDQLSGLRPYRQGEGCPIILGILNSSTFPDESKAQLATGFSGFVSSEGVADVIGQADPAEPDFDFYGFVSPTGASRLSHERWQELITPTRSPPGESEWSAEFSRNPSGTYSCTEGVTLGGE